MKKTNILFIVIILALISVNIFQFERNKAINSDFELEQASKEWWYGASVGCMEESGYWNASKQAIIDDNQSWVFQEGRGQAIKTIRNIRKTNGE